MLNEMENAKQNEELIPDFVEIEQKNEQSEENKGFEGSSFKLYQKKLDELATLAKPYSNKSFETLKKLGKKRLISIILNQNDDEAASNGSANTNNLESIIKTLLQTCDAYRRERIGEVNSQALKTTIENNVAPAFNTGVLNSVNSAFVARLIVVGGLLFICVDSFVGWSNVFKAFKNYLAKAKTKKEVKNAV